MKKALISPRPTTGRKQLPPPPEWMYFPHSPIRGYAPAKAVTPEPQAPQRQPALLPPMQADDSDDYRMPRIVMFCGLLVVGFSVLVGIMNIWLWANGLEIVWR